MTEKKQRLFIYDRKEVLMIVALGLTLSVFSFTLGVHLAKSLGGQKSAEGGKDPTQLHGIPDEVPSRQELAERSETALEEGKDAAREALKSEVIKSNIKVDNPKPLNLPGEDKQKPVDAKAKAPEKAENVEPDEPVAHKAEAEPKTEHAAPSKASASNSSGKFTLQVGSYPSESDANDRKMAVAGSGLDVMIQPVDLGKKGKWYRVYLGGFSSAEEADKTGKLLQGKKSIDTFIVALKPQKH